jgi:hypothetical protein
VSRPAAFARLAALFVYPGPIVVGNPIAGSALVPAPAPRSTLRDSIRMPNTIRQDIQAADADATASTEAQATAAEVILQAQATEQAAINLAATSMAQAVADINQAGGTVVDPTPDPVTGLTDVYTISGPTVSPPVFVVNGYPNIDTIPGAPAPPAPPVPGS